jgi:ABC-2 type transport system permease protein
MQSGLMIVNNAFMLGIFILFFQLFPTMGGMTFEKYVPLYAMLGLVFWIVHAGFAGYERIATMIRDWWLDNVLLTPRSPLLKILVSDMQYSAIGDIASAFLFLAWFVPNYFFDIGFMIRFLLAGIIGSMVFLGIMIFYHSLGFFLSSAQGISDSAVNNMLGSTLYPPDAFSGWIRVVYLSIFPTFWVNFFPYEFSVSEWNLPLLGICLTAAGFFLLLGTMTFRIGLRRYESGNLMVTNV